MPKVSIIMPVYNKAKFLKRTLDAIVSQTKEKGGKNGKEQS